jgi:hypothetical protein
MPAINVFTVRKDTQSNWINAPAELGRAILYEGELGYETDTFALKIGDGVRSFTDLPYFIPPGGAGTPNSGVIDGSGIANYLSLFADTDTVVNSIMYQNGPNIGVGTTSPGYKLTVDGSFSASTKSFDIQHPSDPNRRLVYGSLESPYHGIRITGRDVVRNGECIIHLPDYIKDLVRQEGCSVNLTNIKHSKILFVDSIDIPHNTITIRIAEPVARDLEFFWDLTAIRKDIEDLVVEP